MADETDDAPDTGGVSVTVTPPASNAEDTPPDHSGEIAQIAGRIEALETRITEGLEGERAWTTETITSFKTELENLRADLAQMAQGMPAQIQSLRDELTRLSLSLQTAPVEEPEAVVAAVVTPPAEPSAPEGGDTQTGAPATSVSQSAAVKRKPRVV